MCFKMLLTSGSSPPGQVDGCVMYVFNIQGFITHMVMYRRVCMCWVLRCLLLAAMTQQGSVRRTLNPGGV